MQAAGPKLIERAMMMMVVMMMTMVMMMTPGRHQADVASSVALWLLLLLD